MTTVNTTSYTTNQAYSQSDTAEASASSEDVNKFEELLSQIDTEQLGVEETKELLVEGMVQMSMRGVPELFRKQMLGKPEDQL